MECNPSNFGKFTIHCFIFRILRDSVNDSSYNQSGNENPSAENVLLILAVVNLGHQLRCMSSLVNVNKQGKVAVLELNRKPVNSFSLDFLQEINVELDKLETDQDCQGLIITSVCSLFIFFQQIFDKANVLFFF